MKQLLNLAFNWYHMKNYGDLGGCYPPLSPIH